MLKKILQ